MIPWDQPKVDDFERRFKIIEFQVKKAVEYFNTQWKGIEWDGDIKKYDAIYKRMTAEAGANGDLAEKEDELNYIKKECVYYCAKELGMLDELYKEKPGSKLEALKSRIRDEYGRKFIRPIYIQRKHQEDVGSYAENFKTLVTASSAYGEYLAELSIEFGKAHDSDITKRGKEMLDFVRQFNFHNRYEKWDSLVNQAYKDKNSLMDGWTKDDVKLFSNGWYNLFYYHCISTRIAEHYKDLAVNKNDAAGSYLLRLLKKNVDVTDEGTLGYLLIPFKGQDVVKAWLVNIPKYANVPVSDLADELFSETMGNIVETADGNPPTPVDFQFSFGTSADIASRLDLFSCFAFIYIIGKIGKRSGKSLKQRYLNDVIKRADLLLNATTQSPEDREYFLKYPMFDVDPAIKIQKAMVVEMFKKTREQAELALDEETRKAADRRANIRKEEAELAKGTVKKPSSIASIGAGLNLAMRAAPQGQAQPIAPTGPKPPPVYNGLTPELQKLFDDEYNETMRKKALEQAAKSAAAAASKAGPISARFNPQPGSTPTQQQQPAVGNVAGLYQPTATTGAGILAANAANRQVGKLVPAPPSATPLINNSSPASRQLAALNVAVQSGKTSQPRKIQISLAKKKLEDSQNGISVPFKDLLEATKITLEYGNQSARELKKQRLVRKNSV